MSHRAAILPAVRGAAGWCALPLALLAVAHGLVDAARVALGARGWQLDEWLLIAMAALALATSARRVVSNRGAIGRALPSATRLPQRREAPTRVFDDAAGEHGDGAGLHVIAIGIGRFNGVRLAFGPDVAAALVRAVRDHVQAAFPAHRVERLAEDTLAMLVPAADAERALAALAAIPDGLHVGDQWLEPGIALGSAGPGFGPELRPLVEQAQGALAEALCSGHAHVAAGTDDRDRVRHSAALMAALRTAIADDALMLHYQPKLDARGGRIVSHEALVRWHHPEFGQVSPGLFVPLAEQSGDVRALTLWVLDRACRDAAAMSEQGFDQTVFVNISAQLVSDERFADHLVATIAASGARIGVEVTETSVLGSPERALANLERLAAADIPIAIDDYGVGLSSLTYLRQMPASELKIDMSFIRNLAESHRDPLIVRSTIDLAHGLGLKVTAEGVDKPETLALLKVMGCDYIQGYQIAPAMPLDRCLAFLRGQGTAEHALPDTAAALARFASATRSAA